MDVTENELFKCPICDIQSWNKVGVKENYCEHCKKNFNMQDYVKVVFEFRGKTSEEFLHKNQALEVAQALKRMFQERLHPFMEPHRRDEPEMLEGFQLLRRPLNKVGIDPR